MGIVQHHDAVSGTAKQLVMDDYAYTLSKASEKERSQFIKSLTHFIDAENLGEWGMCTSRNSSLPECPTKAFLDPEVEFIDLHVVNNFKETTIFPRIILPSGNFSFEYEDSDPVDIA